MPTRFAPAFVVFALVLMRGAAPRAEAQATTAPRATVALLDRYAHGEFETVAETLAALDSFEPLLKDLQTDAAAWIAAGGEADRARRELTAATFALEAARIGEWERWKTIQTIEINMAGLTPTSFDSKYHVTLWDEPALLLEWGCTLLRQRQTPTAQEHLWHLAAIAVAERAEDFEFLVGYRVPPELHMPKVIDHAKHAVDRFPKEQRFQLAYGIANEWDDPPTARQAFASLQDNLDGGAEATMRLGAMTLRAGHAAGALVLLQKVESLTRDPWVIYLARYFAGQSWERQERTTEALSSYRGAVAAMPRAQAASVALASLLFRNGQRAEASSIVEAMLSANPIAPDPWRGYADADDRFWPQLIAALRREIAG